MRVTVRVRTILRELCGYGPHLCAYGPHSRTVRVRLFTTKEGPLLRKLSYWIAWADLAHWEPLLPQRVQYAKANMTGCSIDATCHICFGILYINMNCIFHCLWGFNHFTNGLLHILKYVLISKVKVIRIDETNAHCHCTLCQKFFRDLHSLN